MSTHNDALYAYYYTDNASTNNVQVTEIFDFDDVTKQEKGTDLQRFTDSIENQTPLLDHCSNAVVSDWNCIESGKLSYQSMFQFYN